MQRLALITTFAIFAGCAAENMESPTVLSEDAVGAVPDLQPGSHARTTTDLNLRSGPGTGYRVRRVLPEGTDVVVGDRSGRWYAVDALSLSGWVSGRYLEAIDDGGDVDAGTDPGTPDSGSNPGTGCEAWMGTDYTCSPDGTQRAYCSNGSPIAETCDRGCLRSSNGPDACLGTTDSLSCSGTWGTRKATDGDYYITAFGCWTDASGNVHTDAGDNCVPSCLSQARALGVCDSGDSGPDCEERVTWYTADGGRFGCLTRLRITNPANGKSVVGVVLDFGPACRVERSAGKEVLDASGRINRYLFGSDHGWSDRASIHVVEVDSSTPLGPVQ
jgi:uncharacterized protein YraI